MRKQILVVQVGYKIENMKAQINILEDNYKEVKHFDAIQDINDSILEEREYIKSCYQKTKG